VTGITLVERCSSDFPQGDSNGKLTNGVKAINLRCSGSGDSLRLYVLLDVDPDEGFYFDRS
jgi:hypothetical protein